jgi:hypothetical protein
LPKLDCQKSTAIKNSCVKCIIGYFEMFTGINAEPFKKRS